MNITNQLNRVPGEETTLLPGSAMSSELPTGTLTYLFTDLEGSTQLWEQHPNAMQPALARHDVLLHEAIISNQGQVIKSTGDGIQAVFKLCAPCCSRNQSHASTPYLPSKG